MSTLSKHIQNCDDQESIRFIFQKRENSSRVKWYISIIPKVIKPVDFHYSGKEYKSHFYHKICTEFFSLQFGFYYFAKSQNSIIIFSLELSLS